MTINVITHIHKGSLIHLSLYNFEQSFIEHRIEIVDQLIERKNLDVFFSPYANEQQSRM